MTVKKLFQIYLSDSNEGLPPLLEKASESFKQSFPDYSYDLYDFYSLEELIKNEIGNDAHRAFKKLKPYAYKADLGRYCIGYLKGGWYADISIKMLKGINLEDVEFLGFTDRGRGFQSPNTIPYPVQNALFYVNQGNPVLKKAIELVIENCEKEDYGRTPICPTGPGVLGRAIAIVGINPQYVFGLFTSLTPYYERPNYSYLLPSGEIIAHGKDSWGVGARPGEIASYGSKGTNNYIEMYRQKNIYNKEKL